MIYLGDPMLSFGQGAVIAPQSGHHEEVIPIKSEEPLHPWSNPVFYQDLQEKIPVQVGIGLLDVKEDFIEKLLPHFR